MKPPTEFETSRLKLRPPALDDAAAIFEQYARDSEVTRYLAWRPHETIEMTMDFLRDCSNAWEAESRFPYVVIRKNDEHLMGMVELRFDAHGMNLGYVLARSYWGNGYASEAISTLVQWAVKQPGIHRVWAICDVENPASARVMEKAGMQLEGTLRRFMLHPNRSNKPRDCLCYSRVKECRG